MSSSPCATDGSNGRDNNDEIENTLAKTAGFVLFSGIPISILKALNPFNKNSDLKKETLAKSTWTQPPSQLDQNLYFQSPESPPPKEPIFQDAGIWLKRDQIPDTGMRFQLMR